MTCRIFWYKCYCVYLYWVVIVGLVYNPMDKISRQNNWTTVFFSSFEKLDYFYQKKYTATYNAWGEAMLKRLQHTHSPWVLDWKLLAIFSQFQMTSDWLSQMLENWGRKKSSPWTSGEQNEWSWWCQFWGGLWGCCCCCCAGLCCGGRCATLSLLLLSMSLVSAHT